MIHPDTKLETKFEEDRLILIQTILYPDGRPQDHIEMNLSEEERYQLMRYFRHNKY